MRFQPGAIPVHEPSERHLPRTVYRDCHFDRAELRHFSVGTARFERCTFDGARLDGWRSNLAEFVDCHFAGKIRNVKFFGRSNGPLAEMLGWRDGPTSFVVMTSARRICLTRHL